jgi:cytidylate kinase
MAIELNMVVSSWPGAGGTTMALILAQLLNLKYIYAGGVLKEWAQRMGYDPSSDAFHEWEMLYGESWDYLWEDYIKELVTSNHNLLCEGKTAGFLLPDDGAYEVMVTASAQIRAQRAGGDARTEDIAARDKILSERWQRLFDVDIYDTEAILANYDLLLDNSQLTIAGSINKVLSGLQAHAVYSKLYDYEQLKSSAQQLEQSFWADQHRGKSGKDALKSYLQANDLYYTNEEIFASWLKKPEMLKDLPKPMRDAL